MSRGVSKKNSKNVEVVLLPVCVRLRETEVDAPSATDASEERKAGFFALTRKKGDYVRGSLHAGVDALLDEIDPNGIGRLAEKWRHVEPVGFLSPDAGPVQLVFTVAQPVSATESEPPPGFKWMPMHAKSGDAVRDLARDHWRQELEERSTAQLLLPRYFTMRQLIDVYQAVWDRKLDLGNFRKWALHANEGFIHELDMSDSEVQERLRQDEKAALAKIPQELLTEEQRKWLLGEAHSLIERKDRKKSMPVGLNPGTIAAAAAVGVPFGLPVSLALTALAGAIAYNTRTTGPAPQWFEWKRVSTDIRRLSDIYAPRPSWLKSELELEGA